MCGIGIKRYVHVKINIVKKFVQGDIRTLFFCDIEVMANKKKEDRNGPLKLQIKLRRASYFGNY